MLKWIRDQYDAEVVALTVNLGQPGEDYDVVRGKALAIGAIECHRGRCARGVRARVRRPAIKANAIYGLGYPLFTALGRPLIAKLAVDYARRSGCDTIAHGCTGKGNDQVRIEATIATLAPELKVIAPVRTWQMGRDEEVAYAREHGIPVKGGTETAPYSIDDNLWGRSSEGKWIEDSDGRAARRRLPARHAPRRGARRGGDRDDRVRARAAGRPGRRAPRARRADRARRRDRRQARRRHRRPARGPRRRAQGARHLRGPGSRDPAPRPRRARAARLARSTRTSSSPALDQKWAYLVYAGLWCEPLREDLDAYMDAANAHVTGEIGVKLYKGSARVVTRHSPNAVYDAQLATFSESGGLFKQTASPGFIDLWSLQSRMAWRVRHRSAGPRSALAPRSRRARAESLATALAPREETVQGSAGHERPHRGRR